MFILHIWLACLFFVHIFASDYWDDATLSFHPHPYNPNRLIMAFSGIFNGASAREKDLKPDKMFLTIKLEWEEGT